MMQDSIYIESEKIQKRHIAKRILVVGLLILIILICFLGYRAYEWNRTVIVKSVKLTGLSIISDDEVKRTIFNQIINLPKEKINLPNIKNTLEKNPYVSNVSFSYSNPEELEIRIIERIPAAIVLHENGYPTFIDNEGNVLPYKLIEKYADLPVLTGNISEKNYDKEISIDALKILNILNSEKYLSLKSIVSEISYSPDENSLSIVTIQSGILVKIGNYGNINEKLDRLLLFWSSEPFKRGEMKIKTIDLRWKNQVVVS